MTPSPVAGSPFSIGVDGAGLGGLVLARVVQLHGATMPAFEHEHEHEPMSVFRVPRSWCFPNLGNI